MNTTHSKTWNSNWGFILAAVGSAVGLGNLWKFPYISYDNGGGGFVLIYLLTILIIGLPLMIAEIMVGKAGRGDVLKAFGNLKQPRWKIIGHLAILTGILLLGFYSVVGGWALAHVLMSLRWILDSNYELMAFGRFLSDPAYQITSLLTFMGLTTAFVIRGIPDQVETIIKWGMILLMITLAGLAAFSLYTGGSAETLEFLFSANISTLSPSAILEAVGHAFFTLSLGMGAMITYGAKLKTGAGSQNIIHASLWITGLDTVVALLACLMIFPMLFGMGMECSGSGLDAESGALFIAIPQLLGTLPGGRIVSTIFFVLLSFAALSSAIAIMEVIVSAGVGHLGPESKWQWSRRRIALLVGAGLTILGGMSALSHGADQSLLHSDTFTHTGIEFKKTKVVRTNICAEEMCNTYKLCEWDAIQSSLRHGSFQSNYHEQASIPPERYEALQMMPNARIQGVTIREEIPDPKSGVFDIFDYLTSNWFLPLGGLLLSLFVGYVFPEEIKRQTFHELGKWGRRLYPVWRVVVALIVPIAIACVFLSVLGIF